MQHWKTSKCGTVRIRDPKTSTVGGPTLQSQQESGHPPLRRVEVEGPRGVSGLGPSIPVGLDTYSGNSLNLHTLT